MENIKEAHWDREREMSRERVSKLDNETVRLSAEAEAAKKEIATANAEAAHCAGTGCASRRARGPTQEGICMAND
jgi:hypothetical protein